jgi:hypothetical protein
MHIKSLVVKYFLSLNSGGPCGLLAIVQGYVWRFLAFERTDVISEIQRVTYIHESDKLGQSRLEKEKERREEVIKAGSEEMADAIRLSLHSEASSSSCEDKEGTFSPIDSHNPLTPSDESRNTALIDAISRIIWQSVTEASPIANVVLPVCSVEEYMTKKSSIRSYIDITPTTLTVLKAHSLAELKEIISVHLPYFQVRCDVFTSCMRIMYFFIRMYILYIYI